MMAAGRAGELGVRVLLLEKNNQLGKKLGLTGGRRCNITNAEFNPRLFLENFPETKKFLYSSFSQFDVQSTFDFFERRGLPLVIENQNRVFPKSQKSEDVIRTLVNYLKESGKVTAELGASVKSLVVRDGLVQGVKTSRGTYRTKKIIMATGGLAAPETGSTGEGLLMLKKIGHTIKNPSPDLVPLRSPDKWVHELAGASVEPMTLSFIQDGKVRCKKTGRLLFTHFGISGPLVINMAHQVIALLKKGPVMASVDLFPEINIHDLEKKIFELFQKNKNKACKNVLSEVLPKKLSLVILELPALRLADRKINSITKEERAQFVKMLKDLRFSISGTMGLDWSIVADGGVIPQEVNFKTMTSRLFPNLYLVGDTLNINRPSGGFSLQLCWTTGWLAGTHASQTL